MFDKVKAKDLKVKLKNGKALEFSLFVKDEKQAQLAAGKIKLEVSSAADNWRIEKYKDGYNLYLTMDGVASVSIEKVAEKFGKMVA